MDKSFKTGLGIVVGIAAVAGVSYIAYRVAKEIDAMPNETGDYKEKAKKWFMQKRNMFKEMIDEKNAQISEIIAKVKDEIINEGDSEKRKELMENATIKINELKNEIKELMETRTKELSELARKISQSDLFSELVSAVNHAKSAVISQFEDKKKYTNVEADITYYEE